MKMKRLTRIPLLHLNVEQILNTADSIDDAITFSLDLPGWGAVMDKNKMLLLTASSGYLVIKKTHLKKLIEELEWLQEEAERRQRY